MISANAIRSDALVLAKQSGHDVFNALNLLQNKEFLKVGTQGTLIKRQALSMTSAVRLCML